MDENKNTHGGKREGAGRPKGKKNSQRKSPEELATQHSVYTTKNECDISVLKEKISVENHRIEDLEDRQNECIRKRT